MLSANEVPWGPFPEVVDAMTGGALGPQPLSRRRLRGAASSALPSSAACRGVRDLRQRLVRAADAAWARPFSSPQHHVVFPHPSFVMYRSIALANGARFTRGAARRASTTISTPCWRRCKKTRAFLSSATPTIPPVATSSRRSCAVRRERVPRDVVVVLDEAYGEFVTDARPGGHGRLACRPPESGDPAHVLEDLRAWPVFASATASPTPRSCRRSTRSGSPSTSIRSPRSPRSSRCAGPRAHAAASAAASPRRGLGWRSGWRRWESRTTRARRTSCWWT